MSSITPDLAAAISAARALDCPLCPPLAGDECVYSTAPVSVPVVPGPAVRPARSGPLPRPRPRTPLNNADREGRSAMNEL